MITVNKPPIIMPHKYAWFKKMDDARRTLIVNGLLTEGQNREVKRKMKAALEK